MNRFDRILGILLYLRSGRSISATELAERFQVSTRTIYRDMETLSTLGIPVYAERGREGGFQLLEGYFLPPLMFSPGEAVSLLLGLTFLHSLHSKPFKIDLESAEKKLLAAVPDRLRAILTDAQKIIGFEDLVGDAFHPEPVEPQLSAVDFPAKPAGDMQSEIISVYLQAILDEQQVKLQYHSPYRGKTETVVADPFGLFWDRDRWYMVGQQVTRKQALRFWRADRVLEIKPQGVITSSRPAFDVQELLGHNWLKAAMEAWSRDAPVKIRLTQAQANRLQQDWYYRHAKYTPLANHEMLMTFGEDNCQVVLELLRWLGPGAELIEPKKWRQLLQDELHRMLAVYASV